VPAASYLSRARQHHYIVPDGLTHSAAISAWDRVLCNRQRVSKASRVSRPDSFYERCNSCHRARWDHARRSRPRRCSRQCARDGPTVPAGLTSRSSDAAPSCRWCSGAACRQGVRKEASGAGRPFISYARGSPISPSRTGPFTAHPSGRAGGAGSVRRPYVPTHEAGPGLRPGCGHGQRSRPGAQGRASRFGRPDISYVRCSGIVPVASTYVATVSARGKVLQRQQASTLRFTAAPCRGAGCDLVRCSRQGVRKGPAGPAGLTAPTGDAAPGHRAEGGYGLGSRQRVRKGPAVSAGLTSFTGGVAPGHRPGGDPARGSCWLAPGRVMQRGAEDALRWRRLDELRGRRLRCHCPLGTPCHADALVMLFCQKFMKEVKESGRESTAGGSPAQLVSGAPALLPPAAESAEAQSRSSSYFAGNSGVGPTGNSGGAAPGNSRSFTATCVGQQLLSSSYLAGNSGVGPTGNSGGAAPGNSRSLTAAVSVPQLRSSSRLAGNSGMGLPGNSGEATPGNSRSPATASAEVHGLGAPGNPQEAPFRAVPDSSTKIRLVKTRGI